MKDFVCKKCKNTTYIIQEKSNGKGLATGLYCAKCGTWQKWLNKQEKILYSNHSAEIDKDAEIARLTAENAELRARLEKAVELPCPLGVNFAILDYGLRGLRVERVEIVGYNFSRYDKNYITPVDDFGIGYEPDRIFTDRAAAEARLAELKGEDR